MNTNLNHSFAGFAKTILIALMVCVTFFISTNPSVLAQEGNTDRASKNTSEGEILLDPVPGGPGFIMVSVFEFQPYGPSYTQAFWGTGLYNPSAGDLCDSVTGVKLPHGATITKLTAYIKDNTSLDLLMYLVRAGAEGSNVYLTYVQSAGSQAEYRSVSNTSITYPVVDNQNFSYFLELAIPSNAGLDLKLMNVRIDYEYANNLPMVIR